MANHVVEYDEKCPWCSGSGLYVGMAEKGGVAVVCYHCKGTGCHHVRMEHEDFEGRKTRTDIKRVLRANPGIIAGPGPEFGGMPYEDWLAGKPWPARSEMRNYTCPAWWYQGTHQGKPEWPECICAGCTFSSCRQFGDKGACWVKWDKEQEARKASAGEEADMQLWKVRGYVDVVIACDGFPVESEIDDAMFEAAAKVYGLHIRDIVEVTELSQLPDGWDAGKVPWYVDGGDATIADILGEGEEAGRKGGMKKRPKADGEQA